MDYILRQELSENDIDFLNTTDIEFDIINTHGLKAETNVFDSGWCDMATNARIIDILDRAVFRNVTDSQLTLLILRYQDRIKELTAGIKQIYSINDIQTI